MFKDLCKDQPIGMTFQLLFEVSRGRCLFEETQYIEKIWQFLHTSQCVCHHLCTTKRMLANESSQPAFAYCISLSLREGSFVGTTGQKYLSNVIV